MVFDVGGGSDTVGQLCDDVRAANQIQLPLRLHLLLTVRISIGRNVQTNAGSPGRSACGCPLQKESG